MVDEAIAAMQPGMLNRVPLRDQAAEVLRAMVVSGALSSGDRINEADLAARLGISRGPLREAIQRLGAEGFIEFHQNRGAFVRTFNLDDLRQMYEAREVIEVKAAQLAADRATDDGIARLQDLLSSVDEVLRTDTSGAYPVDHDLHELVLDLSGNPYLQRAGVDLQNQVRLARIKSGSSPERARQALTEHQGIIAAIAARDPKRAGKTMSSHIQNSLKHLQITSATSHAQSVDGKPVRHA
jgi:DNA-binding GntR family transcriptional regulator